ncbi:hypothetical protein [Pseudomonas typographi]|uniref:hypothetical protein n=1 Tax=Pseudomonas typographi TaxID=2715964 RepID=UPI0016890CAF|nr:hypothetical protein [Pseudomonas typographi]MBD1589397.1 hypothetical protein [Pseudomonas typographi]
MTATPHLVSASVLDNGIVAFGAGLTAQEIADARNLLRLANQVANKSYDKQTQLEGWYKQYANVLSDLGWVSQHFQFDRSSESNRALTLDNVIDGLLDVAVSGVVSQLAAVDIFKSLAKQAIEALPKDQAAYKLFQDNTLTKAGGQVSVTTCAKLDEHTVYMAIAVLDVRSGSAPKDLLIFNWESTSAENYVGSMVLNIATDELGEGRTQIAEKLSGVKLEKLANYLNLI